MRKQDSDNLPEPLHRKIYNIFFGMMALVYLGIGAFFALTPFAEKVLAPPANIIFGIIVMAVGLWRIVRVVKKFM
ncbi:MAG: hypothetical protein V4543_04330 [Bacteroidota bacterium]